MSPISSTGAAGLVLSSLAGFWCCGMRLRADAATAGWLSLLRRVNSTRGLCGLVVTAVRTSWWVSSARRANNVVVHSGLRAAAALTS